MAATIATATLTARRSELVITSRLNDVMETLRQGGIPHTLEVLHKLSRLTGADFLMGDAAGRLVVSTRSDLAVLPEWLQGIAPCERIASLEQLPAVSIGGTRYFAARLDAPGGDFGRSFFVLYPETAIRQGRRDAATPPLVLGTAALVVMVVVTGWIARRLSDRIGRLRTHVAGIAAGAFEGESVATDRTGDEVDDLARSIDQMRLDLRSMRRGIEQTERARLLAQIAAGFAHQFRNALSGARMSIQLYMRRHAEAAGDESIQMALRQLELTEEQVKGLLSVGRMEQSAVATCDLNLLLDEVELYVEPSCRHARVRLSRGPRLAEEPRLFRGDRSYLRGAILNLTLNAIEAAGSGGWVRLEARDVGNEVEVDVIDSGPGPPRELADRLFEPFVSSKPEGAGLGLALASRVAAGHGGRLSFARESGATRFRLCLPRSGRAGGIS